VTDPSALTTLRVKRNTRDSATTGRGLTATADHTEVERILHPLTTPGPAALLLPARHEELTQHRVRRNASRGPPGGDPRVLHPCSSSP